MDTYVDRMAMGSRITYLCTRLDASHHAVQVILTVMNQRWFVDAHGLRTGQRMRHCGVV